MVTPGNRNDRNTKSQTQRVGNLQERLFADCVRSPLDSDLHSTLSEDKKDSVAHIDTSKKQLGPVCFMEPAESGVHMDA